MEPTEDPISPLVQVEARLRNITPAKLYADTWINPSVRNLTRVFNHLRTLHRILYGYLPRQVIASLPQPGVTKYQWEEGTLMFTDLAGFTPLLEKTSGYGKEGAEALFKILNNYFAEMIQIISKGGGNLLEFTGDAVLVQFPTDQRQTDTARAVRTGLRMQRAMEHYSDFEIMDYKFTIEMRIGLHVGNFLTADIGTPQRMNHILLGNSVLQAKQAEGAGRVGYVCLTPKAREKVEKDFRFEDTDNEYTLVVDDLSEEQLGDYDIIAPKTRLPSMVLFDASKEGMISAIADAVDKVEPLASFIPDSVLKLLVENATKKGLPPDFPETTIIFIMLLGIPSVSKDENPEDNESLVSEFSRIISLINAEIESQGGVMKRVSYHHEGPDIMAFFGVPIAHSNDSFRAVHTAQEISNILKKSKGIDYRGENHKLSCQIGITRGQVFAAEFGERQGRREFNLLGNVVNTAARLMGYAEQNQIILSESVQNEIEDYYETVKLSNVKLKGRSKALTLYELGKRKG